VVALTQFIHFHNGVIKQTYILFNQVMGLLVTLFKNAETFILKGSEVWTK